MQQPPTIGPWTNTLRCTTSSQVHSEILLEILRMLWSGTLLNSLRHARLKGFKSMARKSIGLLASGAMEGCQIKPDGASSGNASA